MIEDILKNAEEKMQKTVDNLNESYLTIRAGRANPNILNGVMVSYYGSPTPINQVANISVPEARLIQIQPWDKGMLKEIEKAINMADIGINPVDDGTVIRLTFPELTEDRRKELSKDIKKLGDDAKVAIRNIRRDANDKVKKSEKDGESTEDDVKSGEDKIQKLTDKYSEKIDKAIEDKTKEIMTV